ncbi:MAG: hypothetical protein R3233_07550, partial [Xanthomonadales bacterium]|nr:hypothetical protein [Xanthomonadales bacterium]
LRRCHPAILIEINNQERWVPLLDALGYRCFCLGEDGRLCPASTPLAGLNAWCLHPDQQGPLADALRGTVRA